MNAVAVCLEYKPSAVEVIDHYLLELTAGNLALRETMKAIRGRPQAVLMVEFQGDDRRKWPTVWRSYNAAWKESTA